MAIYPSAEEKALIEACLNQDRLAQKALYDRYRKAMYTLAYRMTGNFEDASEVLQDTFVRVFKALHKFRQDSTLGAWIKAILVRVALTKIKRRVQFDPIDEFTRTASIDWHHHLDMDYLEKAILSLPDGYRNVFMLIEVEGYKHKEVAQLLGISEGTSKSQLYHAKKHLKRILEKVGKSI